MDIPSPESPTQGAKNLIQTSPNSKHLCIQFICKTFKRKEIKNWLEIQSLNVLDLSKYPHPNFFLYTSKQILLSLILKSPAIHNLLKFTQVCICYLEMIFVYTSL